MIPPLKPLDYPRIGSRDQTILGLDLVCTNIEHPEQYDVYRGNERVAYLLLCNKNFFAYLIDDTDHESPLVQFTTDGIGKLEEHERLYWLTKAAEEVVLWKSKIDR